MRGGYEPIVKIINIEKIFAYRPVPDVTPFGVYFVLYLYSIILSSLWDSEFFIFHSSIVARNSYFFIYLYYGKPYCSLV